MDRQYCTFTLDGHYFGVEVMAVQEIIRAQEITVVPGAPPVIAGLINLRGQIVTAIDLRLRLGLAPLSEDFIHTNVVIQTDDGPVALLVDEIGDVVVADEGVFERPPETLGASARDLIVGAYKLDGRLLLVLDVVEAVHHRFLKAA
jgi:purine-binding chemotaxis protein CheW